MSKNEDQIEGAILTVACLDRLLSRSNGTRGAPPPSFIDRGAALISVHDTMRLGLHVTQEVVLSYEYNECIASIWPFCRVQPGYIALDSATLTTLGLPPEAAVTKMQMSTPTSTPKKLSKQGGGSSKKKSSSKKKRAQNLTPNHRTPDRPPRVSPSHSALRVSQFDSRAPVSLSTSSIDQSPLPEIAAVCIRALAVPPLQALSIELSPPVDVHVFGAEHVAALKRALHGRALRIGMSVPFTVLGLPTSACVSSVRAVQDAETVRVVENTLVTFVTRKQAGNAPTNTLKVVDLGGVDDTAKELIAIAKDMLVLDGDMPSKGALLHGPSGTGKSSLARAVAIELQAHIEEVHGVGVYANAVDGGAVAELESAFTCAAARIPAVLVLDDLDVFARQRGSRIEPSFGDAQDDNEDAMEFDSLAHDVARLLDEMPRGVFVIATTTKLDSVDESLRRAGRLDAEFELEVPDANARAAVLRAVSARAREAGRVSFSDADIEDITSVAYGFVHADIAASWRRSVAAAMQRGDLISAKDVQAALSSTTPSAIRTVAVEVPSTRWADVGGQEAAKARLREAVELPLSTSGRELLARLRLQPARGILLYGPPGCSKTLLARAVACESRANFLSVRGPELLSKWVGASERAVRDVFRRARAAAPAVVFFDEIDALAAARDAGTSSSGAHARVVAQLLAEMDGVHGRAGAHGERVVVIAATNRPDILDRALLRPGRFDAQIYVSLPDAAERRAILAVHTRNTPLADDVSLDIIAAPTFSDGLSGAELAALVREAALVAMQEDPRNASWVRMEHFEHARALVTPRTTPSMLSFFDSYRASLRLGV